MKHKKSLLIICFIICLFSIASVCASDVNDTSVANDNNANVLDDSNQGTFTDLANEIANAGNELNLTKNYVYNDESDSNYKAGIIISKKITINGNGAIIDGGNQSRAFYVTKSDITLRDISFLNSYSDIGGAIFWDGENGVLSNCNFINCSSVTSVASYSAGGGAIQWKGVNGVLSNCNFINCFSERHGSAIYWHGENGVLSNCSFINCSSNFIGTVSWVAINGSISGCSFMNCEGNYSGGGIYWSGSYGVLSNCSFINCFSNKRAGGVDWDGNYGVLSNCSFINCSSEYGGATDWEGENCVLTNSTFVNCYASSQGGAVNWNGYSDDSNGHLNNCSFINCSAYLNAGAVCWNANNGVLINSNFLKCSSNGDGGAIFWYGNKGTLINSNFFNCTNYTIFFMFNGKIIDCNCSSCNRPIIHNSFVKINVVDNIDFNEKLVVNVNVISGATGNISVYVNDSFKKNVNVGKLCYLDDLECGVNIIKVVYNGDNYYEGSEDIAKVIVNKINSSISIGNIIFDYGSSSSTLAVVDGVLDINAFVINHPEAIVNIKNNKIIVSGLDIGNYTLVAVTVPDNNHISVNTTTNIIVNKISPIIGVSDIVMDYGAVGSTNVTIDNQIGWDAKVIGHDEAIISINNNMIFVSGLTTGNYELVVTTLSDDTHSSVKGTCKITVNRIDSSITFTKNVEFNYGGSDYNSIITEGVEQFTAEVVGYPDAKVLINNNNIYVSGLKAGTYSLSVETVPDANHKPITVQIPFKVNKVNPNIIVKNIKGFTASSTLKAIIKDRNGNLINDGVVKFTINGNSYNVNVKKGVVQKNIKLPKAKTYTYTVTFSSNNFNTKSTSSKLVVKQSQVKISANKCTSISGDYFTLKATVKDNNGKKINEGNVKFTINGKSYKVNVKNGVATKKLKLSSVKTYSYKATFSSKYYKTNAVTSKVVVKKQPTYTVKIGKYSIKISYKDYKKIKKAMNGGYFHKDYYTGKTISYKVYKDKKVTLTKKKLLAHSWYSNGRIYSEYYNSANFAPEGYTYVGAKIEHKGSDIKEYQVYKKTYTKKVLVKTPKTKVYIVVESTPWWGATAELYHLESVYDNTYHYYLGKQKSIF